MNKIKALMIIFVLIVAAFPMDLMARPLNKAEPSSQVAFERRCGRPFSFYAPYNFRYYYRELHSTANSPSLIYSNGTFMYEWH